MLTVFALAAAFAAGCGDSGDDSSGDTGGQETTAAQGDPNKANERYTIAHIYGLRGDPHYIAATCGVEDVAAEQGVDVESQGPPEWDSALQTQIVNGVAAQNPDGVIGVATDPVAMFRPFNAMVENGAKLVLYDGTLEQADIASSVVLSDNADGGRQAAKAMADALGGRGKVLVLSDAPGNVIQAARADSFKEEAEKLGLEVVGTEYAEGDIGRASKALAATLAREPDLAGVYTTGGIERDGAVGAMRQAGKLGRIAFVGYGEAPALDLVEKGYMVALISQRPREQGRISMRNLIAALDGEEVEHDVSLPVTVVTRDNMETPEAQDVVNATDC